jgi:lipoate-protein ligase A
MKFFEYSSSSPQELLACDEALLDERESSGGEDVLLFWESSTHFVVLGYTDRAASEANLDECARLNIPVLRRCSGGGTVLQGPGCLNYSLVLRIPATGPLSNLGDTNRFVMERMRDALQPLTPNRIEVQGTSDLVVAGRKFSGNAQRRRNFLLFHGTVLLDFDLDLIERALRLPSRQPAYRAERSHYEFVTNLPLQREKVREALCAAWNTHRVLDSLPQERIQQLVRDKYSRDEWNFKF